jgi:PAS domain S-box-containing protein
LSIRIKAILALIVAVAVLAAALIVTSKTVILRSFETLEHSTSTFNIRQINSAFTDAFSRLYSTAGDWASWDDAYEFVVDRNHKFIEDNMSISGLSNLKINFMLFFNTDRQLSYAYAIDLADLKEIEISSDLIQTIRKHPNLLSDSLLNVGKAGIIMAGDVPVMIACRTILHNENKGPSRGTLIIGRFIDSVEIERLRASTHLPFSLHPITGPNAEPYSRIIRELCDTHEVALHPLNPETVIVYGKLNDILDKPVMLIRVSMHRDVYREGKKAVNYSIAWLIGIMILFTTLIVITLHFLVISRIGRLRKRLLEIQNKADPSLRFPSMGKDEIGVLANGANAMLKALEESQKSLLKSEEKYRILFREMLNGISLHEILCDDQGAPVDFRFLEVNPAFERLTGMGKEKVTGKKASEVFSHHDPEWLKKFGEVALTGKSAYFEQYSAWFGKDLEMAVFSPAKGFFVTTFTDITKRKEAEKEKERMHTQLFQAQKMQAIGELAGGVAHDFNNMLASILGSIELIKKKNNYDNPGLNKYIEIIGKSAQRMSELATKLLAFARKGNYQVVAVNVHETIEEVVRLLEHTVDKRIRLIESFNAEKPQVMGDPGQLLNAVLNLAINARDAMPNGGELEFRTDNTLLDEDYISARGLNVVAGTFLKISVRDTGIGIDASIRERIFEPFFTTKKIGKGTGLGLASVFGTIASHNGGIEVLSQKGSGTTFILYLPSVQVTEGEGGITVHPDIPRGTGTILIIDDEEDILFVTHELLKQIGYSVIVCSNAREGVEYFRRNADGIDLVLLDMIMPAMSGYDCFLELKKIQAEVTVLICSGYALNGDARKVLDAGACGYVQKPYDISTLARAVFEAINT